MKIERVGNYALRLQFDDLHGTGVYTWSSLYDLGDKKRTAIKNYLQALKAQGLSRDPRQNSKPKRD